MERAGILFALSATLVGCGSKATPAPPVAGSCAYDALVAVSDYSSSGVGGFALDGKGYVENAVDLGTDPVLDVSNGRAFYIDRFSGIIFEIDPSCGTPMGTKFDANIPGKAGTTNPQDVAAAPDGTLWVPRYDDASVIQLGTNGAIARTISLSSKTYDPDGNPNASAIAIVDVNGVAKAFVALEVLDDNASPLPAPYPETPSLILQIDVATGAIENASQLNGRNPFGLFYPFGGELWMAEPGDFAKTNDQRAGIERFDPQTRVATMVVREAAFGASVAEIAVTSGCGAAIVADATSKNATSLVTFDPDEGTALTTAANAVLATSGYDLQAMLWVGDVLLVGDRTMGAGGSQYAVHAFDRSGGCVLTKRPDAIFLPQKPIAFRPTH